MTDIERLVETTMVGGATLVTIFACLFFLRIIWTLTFAILRRARD